MKNFFCCLHASTEEILKRQIKDWFKINGKQRNIIPKQSEYVKFRNHQKKIKLPFIIYADFESILVPEDNVKQNPEESFMNKYQKQIACSFGYKLVCVDDNFSKSSKTYLGKEYLINSVIKESKCCCYVMKKYFNKELLISKEDNSGFKNCSKC